MPQTAKRPVIGPVPKQPPEPNQPVPSPAQRPTPSHAPVPAAHPHRHPSRLTSTRNPNRPPSLSPHLPIRSFSPPDSPSRRTPHSHGHQPMRQAASRLAGHGPEAKEHLAPNQYPSHPIPRHSPFNVPTPPAPRMTLSPSPPVATRAAVRAAAVSKRFNPHLPTPARIPAAAMRTVPPAGDSGKWSRREFARHKKTNPHRVGFYVACRARYPSCFRPESRC